MTGISAPIVSNFAHGLRRRRILLHACLRQIARVTAGRGNAGCAYLVKGPPGEGFRRFRIPRQGTNSLSRERFGRLLTKRAQFLRMRASWPRKRLTSHGTLLKCGKWLRSARPNFPGAHFMKNVYEVLRQKEMELTRLEKEV